MARIDWWQAKAINCDGAMPCAEALREPLSRSAGAYSRRAPRGRRGAGRETAKAIQEFGVTNPAPTLIEMGLNRANRRAAGPAY
jgi:hypothetical protein